MRTDVATILLGMGYVIDKDFIAYEDGPNSCDFTWHSHLPRPTEKEIDTAAPAALAALEAQAVKVAESATARDDAKRALTALDTIIAGIDTATLAQAKTAIKQLAQVQRHIILATLGR